MMKLLSLLFVLSNVTDISLDLTVSLKSANQTFQLMCDHNVNEAEVNDTQIIITVGAKDKCVVHCRYSTVDGSVGVVDEAELIITARLFEEHTKSVKLFFHC